jgi:LmbE family N-acetylglucosaminyl deacetylase
MSKLLLSLILLSLGSFNFQQKQKVILAVFAHPDDEGSIAQLLTKYSKTHKVYIIIATDGRYGTKPGFPTGDTLVKLRQTETECACKQMGTEPPIFLNFTDEFDTRHGVGLYLDQSRKLKNRLSQNIKELNPDFIITFGPDGDTGHSDHRMISDMTTEIILKEGWAEKYPLYYIAWTKRDDEKFKMIGGLNTVHPSYINISITYSNKDEQQALQAIRCYKSQFSKEEMEGWIDMETKDNANVFHFRKLTVSKTRRTEF